MAGSGTHRGGARPGAGRPFVKPGLKRVQMVITIAPETRDKLQALAKKRGLRVGRVLDEWAEMGIL